MYIQIGQERIETDNICWNKELIRAADDYCYDINQTFSGLSFTNPTGVLFEIMEKLELIKKPEKYSVDISSCGTPNSDKRYFEYDINFAELFVCKFDWNRKIRVRFMIVEVENPADYEENRFRNFNPIEAKFCHAFFDRYDYLNKPDDAYRFLTRSEFRDN